MKIVLESKYEADLSLHPILVMLYDLARLFKASLIKEFPSLPTLALNT